MATQEMMMKVKMMCKSINIDKVNLDISEINKKEKTLRRKEHGEDYVGGGDRGLHASGIAGGVSGNFWGSGISGVSSREIGCAEASNKLCTAASGECCFLIKNARGYVCPKSC